MCTLRFWKLLNLGTFLLLQQFRYYLEVGIPVEFANFTNLYSLL